MSKQEVRNPVGFFLSVVLPYIALLYMVIKTEFLQKIFGK